jgi:opacity protein-like surface antigen
MRRLSIALAALSALWASPVFGQATARHTNREEWEQCWALQFAVTNATLQSFDGATLAVRRHFSEGSALRLGLTVGDISFSEQRTEDTSASTSDKLNQQTLGVDIGYVGYLGMTTNVTPFLLVGAGVAGHRSEFEDDRLLRVWNADFTLAFGVEWFVHRRVAVSGEYAASLFYQHEQTDNLTSPTPDRTITESVGVGHGRVRMGIAVSL